MRRLYATWMLLLLSASAHSLDMSTQVLSQAPTPAGEPVLKLLPDDTPCLAYYSAAAAAVIFALQVDGVFQFETVDNVGGPTEVALAIDAAGEVHVAYGNVGIELATRTESGWTRRTLAARGPEVSLDLELAPDGVLAVVYSDDTKLRYLQIEGAAFELSWQLPRRPRSIDLEFAVNGDAKLVFWAPRTGNVTDEEWGGTFWISRDAGVWESSASEIARWGRSPALSFDSPGSAVVSYCRHSEGQKLQHWTLSEHGVGSWQTTALESKNVLVSQTGSALVLGQDGEAYALARSKLWQHDRGVLDAATAFGAAIVGREAMSLAQDGRIHAAYQLGTTLYYASIDPGDGPAPIIVEFSGPTSIPRGDSAVLKWNAAHAAGVILAPDQLVLGPSGSLVVSPDSSTHYVLTAINLSGDAVATLDLEVIPVPPTILYWFSTNDEVTATEEFYLMRECHNADRIRIDPLNFESTDPTAPKLASITETTTFVLTATNDVGSVQDSVTVEVVRPFELRSFRASHGTVGSADPVELSWEVFGLADVQIEGVGPVPQKGSTLVVPTESRHYILRAEWEGLVESASVYVEVDDSFMESRFYLSFAPDAIVTEAPSLSVLQAFPVYVLGLSLDGVTLAGVEFGLDLPDGLMLSGSDFHSPRAINVLSPPDFVVGLGECHILDDLHLLATLQFMPFDQSTIDEGSVRLRPAIIPSIPGRVAYATCALDLNGSEIEGAMVQAMQGPPLYLSDERVEALRLEFRAVREGMRARLRWNALDGSRIDRIELSRSWNRVFWERVIAWSGADASSQAFWEEDLDLGAVIHYRLQAFADDSLLMEEFAELRAEDAPQRTRLLDARPNPFNPRTTIHWAASAAGSYELSVLNAAGRLVRRIELTVAAPGHYAQDWDGKDDSERPAASGVYFVQLAGAGSIDRLRLVLLK